MALSTNFKDDILNESVNEKRKYQMTYNDDGTVSFTDVTSYSQTGSEYGAAEVNEERQAINELNSALTDFRNAEALHTETITKTGSYKLNKSISDYKLVEIIMQYGTTNWITTRLFRSSTLSQFPNIMDSAKTSMLECYYNIYINRKSLNVGAISSNTRILIRGIN